jgi:methenyltetrahydromethanopterin cyclohydrolase
LSSQRVGARRADGTLSFATETLHTALKRCDPQQTLPVVYGSGFDANPSQLADITRSRRLLGSDIETLQYCNAPRRFAALLADLAIAAPPTQFNAPVHAAGWLCKYAGGCGGWHIHELRHAGSDGSGSADRRYYQRRLSGRSISLTALVALGHGSIVGFADQTPRRQPGAGGYAFTGARGIRPSEIHPLVRADMAAALEKLCVALPLRGLVSLDFIVDDGECWLLEVNPRLSATAELHDHDGTLFARHLQACSEEAALVTNGASTVDMAEPKRLNGFEIVFASRDMRAPKIQSCPAWLQDRPAAGSTINRGAPLCTVYAQHTRSTELASIIGERKRRALALLSE